MITSWTECILERVGKCILDRGVLDIVYLGLSVFMYTNVFLESVYIGQTEECIKDRVHYGQGDRPGVSIAQILLSTEEKDNWFSINTLENQVSVLCAPQCSFIRSFVCQIHWDGVVDVVVDVLGMKAYFENVSILKTFIEWSDKKV